MNLSYLALHVYIFNSYWHKNAERDGIKIILVFIKITYFLQYSIQDITQEFAKTVTYFELIRYALKSQIK